MRNATTRIAAACAGIGAVALLSTTPAKARAQSIELATGMRRPTWYDSSAAIPRTQARTLWRVSPRAGRYAPIVSAIIPGGGQYLLGDDRFIGYVAVEALAWWKYAKDVHERIDQDASYKTLARRVARSPFANGSPDLLPDGSWDYYEKMRDYLESGPFSLSSVGPIVPDTDATTFNGSRWKLAQSTLSTREAALQQYLRTAIRPEFAWSWKSAQFQYDVFKRTTNKRNDAYRAGFTDLMVISANHILSMVDAFSTVRLRTTTNANGTTSIGARVSW
jgi:hypothetical protein